MKTKLLISSIVLLGLCVIAACFLPGIRDELSWRWASRKNQPENYLKYLQSWPSGRHITQAKTIYDERSWQKVEKNLESTFDETEQISTLEDYVRKFPGGTYVKQAKEKIEDIVWGKTKIENENNAYQQYIRSYPAGRFATEARGMIAKIDRVEALYQLAHGICDSDPKQAQLYIKQAYNIYTHFPRGEEEFFTRFSDDETLGKVFPAPIPPMDADRPKNFLGTYSISLLEFNDYGLREDAETSREDLLLKVRCNRATAMDDYAYVKTNQVLLTHLSNAIISCYNMKKLLEAWGKSLNEKQMLASVTEEPLAVRDYNDEVIDYNKSRGSYNEIVRDLNNRLEFFFKKAEPFAALLPLDELNRFEYSSHAHEARASIQSAPIFVLDDALKLLRSGKVSEGAVLLDAVGEIKIAYLGVLLTNLEEDDHAETKFRILQEDLCKYYEFVDSSLYALSVDRDKVPDFVNARIVLYRNSCGIFGFGIYRELDQYYQGRGREDFAKLFSEAN